MNLKQIFKGKGESRGQEPGGVRKSLAQKVEQLRSIQAESLEEGIRKKPLESIEAERLEAVFQFMSNYQEVRRSRKDPEALSRVGRPKSSFGFAELVQILEDLNYPWTKGEVEKMVWEVDENLDRQVDREEFQLMYKRCVFDQTGLEPRSLFNLVQFLMYDKTCRGRITVEDTLELIYVRYEKRMNEAVAQIFGREAETKDGQEREMPFAEYLQQVRRRDLDIRKQLERRRKKVSQPRKKEDDL